MSRGIRFRRAARREYDDAIDWYEARRVGLGFRMEAAIETTLSAIVEQPDRWAEVRPGVRMAIVPRWEYCVYYRVEPDHVLIVAVYHPSRDPDELESRF